MGISTILFDAGDILYSKPRRKAVIAKFLTDRGYKTPIANDPVERAMRLKAHAGKISVQNFMEWLMQHYGVSDPQTIQEGVSMLKSQQSDVIFLKVLAKHFTSSREEALNLG